MSHKTGGWGKIYLLKVTYADSGMDEENVKVDNSVKRHRERYKNKTITNELGKRKRVLKPTITLKTDWKKNTPPDDCSYKNIYTCGGTLIDESEPLKEATLNDKLIIVTHGSEKSIGRLKFRKVSEALKKSGMRQMGLIAFKTCRVGARTFLQDLSRRVSKFAQVGYYVGYKDKAETRKRGGLYNKFFGTFGMVIEGEDKRLAKKGKKASDEHRVTVVAGNAAQNVNYIR